jgi:peptidoglycan/xylan/chitin deacetylase (PgdA/CDA1 family)
VLLLVAAVVGIFALAHTAPFPFLIEFLGPGRSVWHMPRADDAPTIYLTYDDGPNPTATPGLLDLLAREDATATFFLIPTHITPETEPIVRRIAADGHAIALHSDTRALMFLTPETLAERLTAEGHRLEDLTGRPPCPLFRPHAGWRGGSMYDGLARAGLRLAGWSFRMWDWNWWRRPNANRLAARLASRASDGDIIVMHDGHHENPRADRRHTIDATEELVARLRKRGFRFGTLCDARAPSGLRR